MPYLECFVRAKDTYAQNAIVQNRMRHRLVEILRAHNLFDFKHIFEFGAGNGELSALLWQILHFESYICNDINDYGFLCDDKRVQFLQFDMKDILTQEISRRKFQLITSNATMQWLDFEQTLCDIKQILSPNGYCILSTFGEQNCYESKAITHYGLDYLKLSDMREILERHFRILILEDELFTLHFDRTLDIFRHFKLSGVNAQRGFISKKMLFEYERTFGNRLTYHPVYMLLCHK